MGRFEVKIRRVWEKALRRKLGEMRAEDGSARHKHPTLRICFKRKMFEEQRRNGWGPGLRAEDLAMRPGVLHLVAGVVEHIAFSNLLRKKQKAGEGKSE